MRMDQGEGLGGGVARNSLRESWREEKTAGWREERELRLGWGWGVFPQPYRQNPFPQRNEFQMTTSEPEIHFLGHLLTLPENSFL